MGDAIDRGISLLKAAARSQPDDIEINTNLLSACLKHNKGRECLSNFEELIKHFPNWPQFHYDLLERLATLGHGAILKTAFEDSIKKEPHNYIFHYGCGLMEQIGCNQDKAIEEFKKVTNIMPSFAPAYLDLGIAYAVKDQVDTALEYLDQAKSKNDRMAETFFMLGKMSQSTNPMKSAIYFESFLDTVYPYLARSNYVEYAKMHVQHGQKLFDSILAPGSGKERERGKEICPKCGKEVEKLSILQDANKFLYFLCHDCCLKQIGEDFSLCATGVPAQKREKGGGSCGNNLIGGNDVTLELWTRLGLT